MQVQGVVLKTVEARRFQEPSGPQQIRIDHNSNISMVAPEGDDSLRVEFAYTTSYGPIGVVKIEGMLKGKVANPAEVATSWGQTRQLPPEIAQQVHGAIMSTCIPEAVGLAKSIRLPPPLPLPQVKFEGQQAQGQTAAKPDPYGSPETA